MYELKPDYGLEDAILALWRYRHWPPQRKALRAVIDSAKQCREWQRQDEREAQLEKTLFLVEMDAHA
jgi:hypothetical protein